MNEEQEEGTFFGMKPLINGGGEKECSDKLCPTFIQSSEQYYIDLLKDGTSLCLQCGKCLRYARKKADQRGEPIELAEV
tara:strand:+ start:33136 stop:33372 length:237 start_codon:yes stop_codon:yes gene_type:complete